MVNLTIDGKQITVSKTATIYEAALEAGIHIPVLCYARSSSPSGPAASAWCRSSR